MKKYVFTFIAAIILTVTFYALYNYNLNKEVQIQSILVLKKDSVINTKGFVIKGVSGNQYKIVHSRDSVTIKDFKNIASFNDTLVYAKYLDLENTTVFKKLSPNYLFQNYETLIYKGALKAPDFSSNPEAKMFKTRIVDGCKDGINFAGKYTLIYWGCGTACQYGVIVDRENGFIYSGFTSSLGAVFNANSKMIIFNSELEKNDNKMIRLEYRVKVKIQVWEKNSFIAL